MRLLLRTPRVYSVGMRLYPSLAKLIFFAYILAALFGIYGMVSLGHSGHSGCPASGAEHALCVSPLEHLGHWQAVFMAIFADLLVLLSLAAALWVSIGPAVKVLQPSTWRLSRHEPPRPTLLQELFSQGILHRKEPQIA